MRPTMEMLRLGIKRARHLSLISNFLISNFDSPLPPHVHHPLDDLLRLVIEEEASDLHLSVGIPPTLRLKGLLTPLNTLPLTAGDMETLARGLRAGPDGPRQHGWQRRFRLLLSR